MKDNKMILILGAVIVVVAVYMLTRGRGGEAQPTTPVPTQVMEAPEDSSIDVSNQAAGASAVVDSASFVGPGYIVIHEQKGGKLGPVIGHSELYETGSYESVSVTLDRPSVSGETLYAMLHDDDGNAEYEFPGADTPTKNLAGEIVLLPFEVE